MKDIIKAFLLFYKQVLSPNLGMNCRFWPTCSDYTIRSVEIYGVMPGLWRGLLRVLRCNALFSGGYDPVPLPACGRQRRRAGRGRENVSRAVR